MVRLITADMLKLYIEIFDQSRLKVWEKLKEFNNIGVLAGGTALSLQLKHRKSYDFDIFCAHKIPQELMLTVKKVFSGYMIEPQVDSNDELTVLLNGEIKLSFVYFPFPELEKPIKTDTIALYSVNDLLSNKAYAIGRRSMWRDYVDIYWALVKKVSNLERIIKDAEKRFDGAFAEKLFLEQLTYFDDLKENEIEWVEKSVSNQEIKTALGEMVGMYLNH